MQENVKNLQVVLDTQGEISPPAGEWEILVKGLFHRVVKICQGVILTI